MLLPENAIPLLAEAFSKLLGKSTAGNMVFARCLLPEIVRTLAANPLFHIDGWQVAAVIEKEVVDKRYITADKAVEWREDKQDATLLLIDPATAGAGMDGIYSAAREIRESELFDYAHKVARNKLPMRGGYRPIVDKALSKARRASQQRTLVPWNVFIYLCYVALDVNNISKSLPIIGLWSIATHGKPNEKELDQSAILIEKIFPVQGSRLTPEQRVEILKLDDSQYELKNQLIDFLRETERLPRLEALSRLEEKEYFYLDQLDLGLFDEQELKSIEWVSWRGKTGKPYTWSGLSLESSTDNKQSQRRLVLFLNPDPDRPRERAHLEVRWKIEPETLPKGTVDYIIQVRTAHDVLAEKTVTHSGKALQKVIFSQDDFNEEELNDNILFEPQVIISTLGEENHKDESEDFILQFGQAEQKTKKSSGKVYPTLSLAITHIVSDGDIYKKLAQQHCDESIFSQDKNGYITCRYNSKVARVHCPPLLNEITKDWIERNGDLGRWQIRVRADGTQVGKPEFIVLEVDQSAERLIETSRKFAKWIDGSQGALGILYNDAKVFNDYVLAANAVWKDCVPELTLIHTLEVVSLAGHRLGMIVLPTHPLRVAWQQSFDLLVEEHRYEKKLSASKVQQLLKTITSAHYPALLPGFNSDETFVFADTLGFHAVALIPANDPEPKATVALLARLLGDGDNAAPTVGKSAATALANEVRRYLQLHENYWRIQVHALRTGDAMPVTRALGEALRDYSSVNNNEDEELANNRQTRNNKLDLCYELNLYPAGKETELTGRFLSNTAERYRNNSNAVSENDRWFMDSISCSGGINIPRLRWAK